MPRQVARMDRVVCPAEEVTSYSDASLSTRVQSVPILCLPAWFPHVSLFSSLLRYMSVKTQFHSHLILNKYQYKCFSLLAHYVLDFNQVWVKIQPA